MKGKVTVPNKYEYDYEYRHQVTAIDASTLPDVITVIQKRLPKQQPDLIKNTTVKYTTLIDVRIYMHQGEIRVSNRRIGFMDKGHPGLSDLPLTQRELLAHLLAYRLSLALEKIVEDAEDNKASMFSEPELPVSVTLGDVLSVAGDFDEASFISLFEAQFKAVLAENPSLAEDEKFDKDNAENALSTVLELPYINIPSPFDINFTGPTRVHVWSQIGNLLFTPTAIQFRNPRDVIYYRNRTVSRRHTLLKFDNAYDDESKDKSPHNTPYNQQHKIDFDMVMPQKGISLRKEWTWLLTPLRVDPPWGNGGGGVPSP